ncbi:protein FAM83G isoform X1 [Micropterus salmoides]|uniref:protein FAM83G isoform X1 n=1 Tax=Micropterus salmoides TaxID=27706 RepID=UPI0018EAE95F|nr:protein FAM83G isoform X1 [Micropterus salmoides]
MDDSSVSVLWYRRSKPLGKVRRRVQDLRIPFSSSSYYDFIASRPTLDLSHNESARLAVDSLLSRGLEGYHKVLNAEGEVDFLSEPEKIYIVENGKDVSTADPGASDNDKDFESLSAGSESATRCPAMSTDRDPSVASLDLSSLKDVMWSHPVLNKPNTEVYFQCDSRAAGMKDLVREFIRNAGMDLAIVMDSFSDVELLCDLLEASRKRNVSVHLLLDHLNLNLFVSMWQDLKLNSKNFPKLSVRSVDGQTYCAKTGRKLTGQVAENFVIADWTEVLTGSYSFSWLSWQVHRGLAVLLRGSAIIPFHQEFHRLYSSSKPVPGFVTYITVPRTLPGAQMHGKPPQLYPKPLVQPGALQNESMGKAKHTVGAVCTQHDGQTNVEPLEKNQNHIQSHSKPLSQTQVSHVQSQLTSLTVSTTAEKNARVQASDPLNTSSPAHGEHRTLRYQTPFQINSNLEHNVGTEGFFYQQRNGDRLTKPSGIAAGLNTQRRQWNCSLNFKPKMVFLSDNAKVPSPSTSQQTQVGTDLWFPLTSPRAHTSGLQMSSLGTRRQDQHQRHHPPPLLSHPPTETPGSKPASTAMGSHPGPQIHPDSKLFLPGTGPKLHLQLHTSQQVKPPPRLNWMPQSHAARPRPVARQSSFTATYGTGQNPGGEAGWRPLQSSKNTSLGRSMSMTDTLSRL